MTLFDVLAHPEVAPHKPRLVGKVGKVGPYFMLSLTIEGYRSALPLTNYDDAETNEAFAERVLHGARTLVRRAPSLAARSKRLHATSPN